MPDPGDLTGSEVRRRVGLHLNQAGRQVGNEWCDLCAPEFAPNTNLSVDIDTVNLEHILREVEPDRHDHYGIVEPPYIGTLIMPHGGNARHGWSRGRPRHQFCVPIDKPIVKSAPLPKAEGQKTAGRTDEALLCLPR